MLTAAVPIGLAGLGGLWSERAGVVNIGLEGMMILGTFGAGWIGWQSSPWLGLLCGIGFGVLGGLVHAVATVTFGVDHIVSGVAVNLLALGATQYLAKLFFSEGKPRITAEVFAELEAFEREACEYSLQVLHDAGIRDMDQWISDYWACDFAYLLHFYRTGEKRPFRSFWREGSPRIGPRPIPAFTPQRWVSRADGVVV